MNLSPQDHYSHQMTATDLAQLQYYEDLLEEIQKKLTLLRARKTSPENGKITMDILLEENIAIQIEKEIKRLKNRTSIPIL